MATCFLSEKTAKKSIRRVSVRNDLVDASCYVGELLPGSLPVLVSTRLVNRLRPLGAVAAVEKLKLVVSRGVAVSQHNRNKKGNFIVDEVPREFYAVERYYGGNTTSIVIDCVPLHASGYENELLRANG